MALFTVDLEKCNKDGICAAVCPSKLIVLDKDGTPTPVADAEEACLVCGHCVAACPTQALSHKDMPAADCPPVRPEWALSPEQAEHFLRSRRSIRTYKKKAVPKEDIVRLIDIARYAPSGHNSQPVRWMVYDDPDKIKHMAQLVIDWMREKIEQKDPLAQVFHMDQVVARWEAGHDSILRRAPVLIVTHGEESLRTQTSSIIALTYLELAAPPMGLGGCWAGFFNAAVNDFKPLQDELALPAGHATYGSMLVGYPLYSYHRLPLRKTPHIQWR